MIYRFIILSSIKKTQYERSVSAVYYLLQGKQSIQSIQDAYLFKLSHYYRIYKHLNKSNFMKEIQALTVEGFLQRTSQENFYELTNKGNMWLEKNEKTANDLSINGMAFHQIDDLYLARLLLLIQVWTNGFKKNRTYIPVIEIPEVKTWVKYYYQQTKTEVSSHLQALYDELLSFLQTQKQEDVEIFTLQLTSYKKFGLATVQLAEMYHKKSEDIHLMTMNVVHSLLQAIETDPQQYRVLNKIKTDLVRSTKLTYSASKTDELLKKDLSLEQIAERRQLKINTIYDHIVEIAIQREDFLLTNYMTNEQQSQITTAIQQAQSYTLKDIKLMVDESISYFQIRLVLAIWNKFNL